MDGNKADMVFTFQFHLVRLKGPGWHEAPAPCAISIPFSTIKSPHIPSEAPHIPSFQFHLVRLKVMKTKDVNNTPFIFQFHLVRLKASSYLVALRSSSISIPFSTIKRKSVKNYVPKPTEFQFHLVRLKANRTK